PHITPYSALTPPSVPREYNDLYSMMDKNVSAFEARVGRSWDVEYSDVQFGAELLVANCNRVPQLLHPRAFEGAKLELTRLQNLGVRAVTVCIGFPLLDRAYLQF